MSKKIIIGYSCMAISTIILFILIITSCSDIHIDEDINITGDIYTNYSDDNSIYWMTEEELNASIFLMTEPYLSIEGEINSYGDFQIVMCPDCGILIIECTNSTLYSNETTVWCESE